MLISSKKCFSYVSMWISQNAHIIPQIFVGPSHDPPTDVLLVPEQKAGSFGLSRFEAGAVEPPAFHETRGASIASGLLTHESGLWLLWQRTMCFLRRQGSAKR
mmetsp:Transcript_24356/g.60746  ORF Transcript_24356/g.60746 Transcript_24356/m.60746 type:complete len:103 (+) Transcript_24356:123-431(+)